MPLHLHALRRPHLAHPERRQGARHPHRRRARRGHRGVRGRRRGAAVGAARRGRGHRRAGHHQHHHRAEERAARAVARGPDRRRRTHRAAGPRRAAGHRPAPAGRAARQALPQDARACATSVRRWPRPSRWRRAACRGRCSSSARWTCSTTRPRSASGTPTRPARAARCADRALRWYLSRHAERMFAGSQDTAPVAMRARWCRRHSDSACAPPRRRSRKAERPLIVIGSQAVVQAQQAGALAEAVERLGIPVYLSGMARGLLGPRPPAADAPPAPQGAARGRLRAAGRRALRLPPRLRQPCAPQRDADRRQPQHPRRPAQPPARRRRASATPAQFMQALAAARAGQAARVPAGSATLRARDDEREAEIDAQAAARASSSTRSRCFRALEAEAGDERASSSPTAATSSPPPATCCTRAAR